MATEHTRAVGMAHPTVVPANFEPEGEHARCPECGRRLTPGERARHGC